jgi:site-specific recombinase XerD
MAYLRKINGSYYAYFYDRERRPKKKSYPLGVSLKSAADAKRKRLEQQWAEGTFDPWNPEEGQTEALTVLEGIDRFLEAKEHLRDSTVDTYRQQLEAWSEGLAPDLMLDHLGDEHFEPYVWQSDISAASRCKRYRHVRVFVNWARQNDHLTSNPISGLKKPKEEQKEPAFLSPEDLETLLEVTEQHGETTEDVAGRTPDVRWLIDTIKIAVSTGLRRGELVNLRWADIDFSAEFVTVRNREDFRAKSGHERRVPLAGDALDVLQERHHERDPHDSDPVIIDREGEPVKPDRITKRFKDMVEEAGLDDRLHFHSLRHTCASWLSMKGVPLRVIQSIMGHSEISVTERYSHLQPEVMSQAMEETFEED